MTQALQSILLSVMLVMSSIGFATARGADPAVDRMVICIGASAQVVYIDAEGRPTAAPHLCPDCTLHALDAVLPTQGHVAHPMRLAKGSGLTGNGSAKQSPDSTTRVRGPPLTV
ncbi:hypothetical protein [uncultured Tateyamaria sp.]|uniref:hypothetical protein n=1 Tax=uncultured Tateyamaria sp. TaxID=455651 RepID=UPI0026039C31|nr:hypothetical protein [uncultured Tateyamaria sp.]